MNACCMYIPDFVTGSCYYVCKILDLSSVHLFSTIYLIFLMVFCIVFAYILLQYVCAAYWHNK